MVLFRPVEQTTSRAIVERRAKGEETRSVVRSGLFVTAGVLVVVALLSAVGWNLMADRLFGGDDLMVALLLAGVGAYAAQYLIRGLLGGLRWFNGYAICLVADGAARVLVASRSSSSPPRSSRGPRSSRPPSAARSFPSCTGAAAWRRSGTTGRASRSSCGRRFASRRRPASSPARISCW